MANLSLLITVTLVLGTMSMLVHTRPLTNIDVGSLMSRLKLDGQDPGCWDTLLELQACTGEIILFFINGETFLGRDCCRAIEKNEKFCWSSLMPTLGFTSEEGLILRGYCDVSDNDDVPTATPPPRTTMPPPRTARPSPPSANAANHNTTDF